MFRSLALTLRVSVLLALTLSPHLGLAQMGDRAPPVDLADRYRAWSTVPESYPRPPKVDLRPFLPPPGEQLVNDCLAWAVAYGAKTYYEALDQGWTPNHPSRIFSPSYLYNQVNRGKDDGSNIIETSELLKTKGVATLEMQPYLGRNYTREISPDLLPQAILFRTNNTFVVNNWTGIRNALAQGDVVIFSVNTNPVFNSGRYAIYTEELHKRGYALRKPNQPHALHAMLFVGYDDEKEAFLVMNSWSRNWGQGGFVWVSYDVCKTYNTETDQSRFINWTAVLHEHREKVEKGPDGRYRTAQTGDISILNMRTAGVYRGWDDQTKEYRYLYEMALSAHQQTLQNVEMVEWFSHDGTGEREIILTATNADNNFRAVSLARYHSFKVKGLVTMKDGTTHDVESDVLINLPSVEDRQMEISSDIRYWGRDDKGNPAYQVTFLPQMSLYDMADLEAIEWDMKGLGTFDGGKTTYTWQADGHSNYGREPYFVINQTREIAATLVFRDGSKRTLTHTPDLASAPIVDTPRVVNNWRDIFTPEGTDRYTFSVWLEFPESIRYQIERVTYDVGPIYDNREVQGYANQDFILDGYANKEFDLIATIHYTDGTTQTLTHWVELGPEGKHPDGNLITVDWTDEYLGSIANTFRYWEVVLKPIGHRQSMADLEKVVYHLPADRYEEPDVEVTRDLIDDLSLTLGIQSPLDIEATLYLSGGRQTRVKLSPYLRTPVRDAIGLTVDTSRGRHIDAEKLTNNRFRKGDELLYWQTNISGPRNLIYDVRQVEYHYFRYGRMMRAVDNHHYYMQPQFFRMSEIMEEPFDMVARFTYTNGWEEEVSFRVNESGGQSPQPPHFLRYREKFYGWEDGQPLYVSLFSVEGSGPSYDSITKVEYKLAEDFIVEKDTRPFQFPQLLPIWQEIEIRIHREEQVNPEIIPFTPKGLAHRPINDLNIHYLLMDTRGEERRWVAYLDGWEKSMRHISKVTWKHESSGTSPQTVEDRVIGTFEGYPAQFRTNLPTEATALVTFKDGTTREITGKIGSFDGPFANYRVKDYHWEGNTWEFFFSVQGDRAAEQRLISQVEYSSPQVPDNRQAWHRPNTAPHFMGRWLANWQHETKVFFSHITGSYRELDSHSFGPGAWAHSELKLESLHIPAPAPGDTQMRRMHPLYYQSQKTQHPDRFIEDNNERVYFVVGPEKDLHRIKQIRYTLTVPSINFDWEVIVDRRHGPLTEGFEMRLFNNVQLKKAIAEYHNPATGEITGRKELAIP